MFNEKERKDIKKGIYLYCLTLQEPPKHLFLDLEISFSSQISTINKGELYLIAREVDLRLFQAPKEEEASLQWLEENVMEHRYIMDQIMEHMYPLPFSFATILPGWEACEELLESQYSQLLQKAQNVQGLQEWNIRLFAQQSHLKRALSQNDPMINEIQEKIRKSSKGAAYMLKKQLEIFYQRREEEMISEFSSLLSERLTPYVEVKETKKISDQAFSSDEMLIFEEALLVAVKKRQEMISALTKLDEKFISHGFSIQLMGPWPVYTFSPAIVEEGSH